MANLKWQTRWTAPRPETRLRASSSRLAEFCLLAETDVMRDATIQRFEFIFEVVWKALKLDLERQGRECGEPRALSHLPRPEHLV